MWLLLASILYAPAAYADSADARDLDVMLRTIADRYPYLDRELTDLDAVRDHYRPLALAAASEEAFIPVIEGVLESLVDDHATLGTNLPGSTRLVPTGLDVYAA